MKKIIIAQLSVKKESIEPFLEIIQKMVLKSSKEDGCLAYRLLSEVDKPNEFVIYEKYTDTAAITFHNSSMHFKEFIQNVPKFLLKEPIIEIY